MRLGVPICFGGDIGVYPHGDNVRELELMVDYGMETLDVVRAATSGITPEYFDIADRVGAVRAGLLADLIAVEGDPTAEICGAAQRPLRDEGRPRVSISRSLITNRAASCLESSTPNRSGGTPEVSRMETGLIGLPNSGKTTVFNAITRSDVEVTAYANPKAEPHVAIVNVDDDRVDRLAEIYEPKKTLYSHRDVHRLRRRGAPRGTIRFRGGLSRRTTMGLVKNTDALAYVVRNFTDPVEGEPNPVADVEKLDDELLLADLIIAEKRLEKIDEAVRKGIATNEIKLEGKALERVREALEAGGAARDLELTGDERLAIKGFQFLTREACPGDRQLRRVVVRQQSVCSRRDRTAPPCHRIRRLVRDGAGPAGTERKRWRSATTWGSKRRHAPGSPSSPTRSSAI